MSNKFNFVDKNNQQKKFGVNMNSVYLQINKYENNPKRKKELEILRKAALAVDTSKNRNARYTKMTLDDIKTCFGYNSEKLQTPTFIPL